MTTIDIFVEKLKQHLADNEDDFIIDGRDYTYGGGGDIFNFDALLEEIDKFAAEFKSGRDGMK